MDHPLFEIVVTTAGATSIRNKLVNEIMHNPVGPWIEANSLYIEQSKLRQRLLEPTTQELVLFDVGLGAAANSLATLACFDSVGDAQRPLKMISFEKDLTLLEFALAHADQFEHFRGYENALAEILKNGYWENEKKTLSWSLRHGDFLELIETEAEKPHLIFYDPYSPKVNQDMWTTACFKKLRQHCRVPDDGGTCLYTYSQATRIRVSLIAAGFFVGYGTATGLKTETTEAATGIELLKRPLGNQWFTRWQKSHQRYPFDCAQEQQTEMDQAVQQYMNKWA